MKTVVNDALIYIILAVVGVWLMMLALCKAASRADKITEKQHAESLRKAGQKDGNTGILGQTENPSQNN